MQVLQLHTNYSSSFPSGENLTVSELTKIVSNDLCKIETNYLNSDDLKGKKLFLQVIKIFFSRRLNGRSIKSLIDFDFILIHNEFPVLPLAVLRRLNKNGISIIRVVHNYRASCLAGTNRFRGDNCFKCTKNNFSRGIKRGCYRGSRTASFIRGIYSKSFNKHLLASNVHFVAISENIQSYLWNTFGKDIRVHVIHNSVKESPSIFETASEVIFIGRLESEKGVENLLNTWKYDHSLPRIHIIGSGSLSSKVQESAILDGRVIFHGKLTKDQIDNVARDCKVAIFPNTWIEPFGRTYAEALSRGQAMVSTSGGIADSIISVGVNGYLTDLDFESLAKSIKCALQLPYQEHYRESKRLYQSQFSNEVWESNWSNFLTSLQTEKGK